MTAVKWVGAAFVALLGLGHANDASANSDLCRNGAPPNGYHLTVKTRDVRDAGTNATLKFAITGEAYGSRSNVTLKQHFVIFGDKSHVLADHSKDDFVSNLTGIEFGHRNDDYLEQDSTDFTGPMCIDQRLERILSVSISTDGKGRAPDWFGEELRITNPDGWEFVCPITQWLEDAPITALCRLADCSLTPRGRVAGWPHGCRCTPRSVVGLAIGTAAYPHWTAVCPSAHHAGVIDENGGAVLYDLVGKGNRTLTVCGPFKGTNRLVNTSPVESVGTVSTSDSTIYFPVASDKSCAQSFSDRGSFEISKKNGPNLYLGLDLDIDGGILRTSLQSGMVGVDGTFQIRMRDWLIANDADFLRNYARVPTQPDLAFFISAPIFSEARRRMAHDLGLCPKATTGSLACSKK